MDTLDLLPKIEAGGVGPVVRDVFEVGLDDGVGGGGVIVQHGADVGFIAGASTVKEEIGVFGEHSGTNSRTISLGTTPTSSVRTAVDVELGLADTAAGEPAAGVVGVLKLLGLGSEIFEVLLERGVAVEELIQDDFVDQTAVSCPLVVVVGAVARRGSDDRSGVDSLGEFSLVADVAE